MTRFLAAAYARPPLSWSVALVRWLATPLRPIERRWNERRAAELDQLADLLAGRTGFETHAAQLRAAATARRARH